MCRFICQKNGAVSLQLQRQNVLKDNSGARGLIAAAATAGWTQGR